jgi:hypothetical protein
MDALTRAKKRFGVSLTITLVLTMAIAATLLFDLSIPSPRGVTVGVFAGTFGLAGGSDDEDFEFGSDQFHFSAHWPSLHWRLVTPRFTSKRTGLGAPFSYWTVEFPLWPLLLPPAIIAFRAHRTVRRLSRAGCKHCGYSRAGLAADATCPECGHPPASAVAASESAPR